MFLLTIERTLFSDFWVPGKSRSLNVSIFLCHIHRSHTMLVRSLDNTAPAQILNIYPTKIINIYILKPS
jgi:hypothetical protein